MTELLLVRHGETAHTRLRLFSGVNDEPLTDEGRAQASRLSPLVLARKPVLFYSSDLARCRETAGLVAPDRHVIYDERLREMDFGLWEGLSWEEVRGAWPGEWERWQADWVETAPPGGESCREMAERVLGFVAGIGDRGGPVAVVTHAGCITTLLAALVAGDMALSGRFVADAGKVSRLELHPGGARLLSLNEG